MINSIYSSYKGITRNTDKFNSNSEAITRETTINRKEAKNDLVSLISNQIKLPHGVKANINTLKTSDEMIGEIIDLKK